MCSYTCKKRSKRKYQGAHNNVRIGNGDSKKNDIDHEEKSKQREVFIFMFCDFLFFRKEKNK